HSQARGPDMIQARGDEGLGPAAYLEDATPARGATRAGGRRSTYGSTFRYSLESAASSPAYTGPGSGTSRSSWYRTIVLRTVSTSIRQSLQRLKCASMALQSSSRASSSR